MKFLAILILSVISISAFADESGYIMNGKKVVLYKDGIKQEKVSERAPSSTNVEESKTAFLQYMTDDSRGVACYWLYNRSEDVSCVKTK